MNVDDHASPLVLEVPKERLASAVDPAMVIASSPGVFVGWATHPLTVAVVVRRGQPHSAARLGRRLLRRCMSPSQVGDALRRHTAEDAVVVAANAAEVRAWKLTRGVIRALTPTDGLLTLAAGHSSADPLPGGGWLIERLERLHRRPRIDAHDLEEALAECNLGRGTACTLVVEPAKGLACIQRAGRVEVLARAIHRKSA